MSLVNIPLSDLRYDEIGAMIKRSYVNACILWLDEVHNPVLQERYEAYKEDLKAKRGGAIQELLLFHGTNEHAINAIARDGFDHTMNTVSAYGKGTYFAKEALMSTYYSKSGHNDISFMFICKVACHTACQGSQNKVIDTTKYDHAVNNIHAPTIYAIPDDDAAVPVYIVAFYKNAPQ